jgi:methyl-accepting chemotaxis protein
MKILDYLKPENQIALSIIYILLGLFGLWLLILVGNVWRHLRYRNEIKSCEDVNELVEPKSNDATVSLHVFGNVDDKRFRTFQELRRLSDNSPITWHLQSIFEAGRNESQLDVRSLIKNTSDKLLRSNSLLRSLLSIFIILGLLGTLFGLADTLASLDGLLRGSAKLDNEVLGQSLQHLLGTLKSAFAPSIWGVSLTVVGVLLLALDIRVIALPLVGLLERLTLTVWVPQLIPTKSQRLLATLQITEQQMQRSFAAAQRVAEFAEGIQEKTGKFGQTLDAAGATLGQMTKASRNLDTFSENFIEGVKILAPFQQDLRNLYQQVADESKLFHQSVQSSIVESRDFRTDIQRQLTHQHEQLTQMLGGLKSYEAAYITNRQGIDQKLGLVLIEAQNAFESLSHRNEEIAASLDVGLGKPLRDNLAQNLGAIQVELQKRLAEVTESLSVELGRLNDRMGRLDEPLNKTAERVGNTFANFDESNRKFLEKAQLEFEKQNDTNRKQLDRLESLSQNVPRLLETLSQSSRDFSGTSSNFAAQGQQLSSNVTALSKDITTLNETVESLKEHVTLKNRVAHLNNTERGIADLISQQTRVLQQLGKTVEAMSSRRREYSNHRSDGDSTHTPVIVPEPRWRDRVRIFFTGK